MRKVGIIGLGHVGATLAYTLVREGLVDELVLIDKNEKLALSEEYDLLDAQIFLTSKTKIIIQDYSALQDADIVVLCAGQISALGEDGDRFKELAITSKIVEETAPKIVASGFKGILISITNPCDVIATYLQKLTGFPVNKVIGTGTMLDTARMKQAVGRTLGIDGRNVGGFVYGEHGDSQFTAWSTVTIGDQSLAKWDESVDIQELEQKVRDGGWKAYAGKGYTSYGIASCAANLIRMILNDTKTIVPVSAYSKQHNLYFGQPVIVGQSGIITYIDYTLTKTEVSALKASIQIIKAGLEGLPYQQ
ncbi:L-lactate dehydrogenase [Enterococcus sp. UD-01]|jgi:L-lactate dehydrogenase|uniref:L-lactate dehydrogenase n=1 Tax=Enterococcus sp. UD-01 TaxID=3373911 RepID=UPI003835DFA2